MSLRNFERKKGASPSLVKITMIVKEDSTLKLPVFHGNGKEGPKQLWFVCEVIWPIKQTANGHVKITLLETTFRDCVLAWYLKFKSIAPMVVGRRLVEIQQALFKEF